MSVTEFGGIGFALGTVRGARSFQVDKLGRLTGVSYSQVWRPGENDAECRKADASIGSFGFTFDFSRYGARYFGSTIASPIPAPAVTPSMFERAKSLFTSASLPVDQPLVVRAIEAPKPVEPEKPKHNLESCACGFYGYYDGSDDYHKSGYVSAVVEGYGETVIGTRGFRAYKARIVALRIPKSVPVRSAALVARNYPNVPLFTSFKQMVEEFPPDAGGMDLNPESDPDFWTRSI